jgi:lipid-A-disaccharide synthase
VVAYKVAPLTYWVAKRLVKTSWVSLPNLISQQTLVPELIQEAATPETIAEQLSELLNDEASRHSLEARFASMHATLQRNASRRAADAIDALVAGQPLDVQDDAIDGY